MTSPILVTKPYSQKHNLQIQKSQLIHNSLQMNQLANFILSVNVSIKFPNLSIKNLFYIFQYVFYY